MTGWFYTRSASLTRYRNLELTHYIRRDESPLRQTIWYSSVGWGGMIGSLMAAGISRSILSLNMLYFKADRVSVP